MFHQFKFSMSNETIAVSSSCGACRHPNSGDAQFCVGCGHSLFEKCCQCGNAVSLKQKFCVSCGEDLAAWLESRLAEEEARLMDAVSAAKEKAYDRSLALLDRVSRNEDFRFQGLAEKATQAKGHVEKLRDRLAIELGERVRLAKEAAEREDHASVLKHLGNVPDHLLDDESRQLLRSTQAYADQMVALQEGLKQSLATKSYTLALGILEQLLELQPDNQKYIQLASQLGEKTVRRAEKLFSDQAYERALHSLDSIPVFSRPGSCDSLRKQVENALWFSQQFEHEPFATKTLGRLAMRYAKEFPQDLRARQFMKDLASGVKAKRSLPGDAFARLYGKTLSWLGGELGTLAQPQSIDVSEECRAQASDGTLAVAIGLSLQGLGQSRVTGNLIEKKGLLAKLSFGKVRQAWGVDVGGSAVRAVLMRLNKGDPQPTIERVLTIELDTPTCRGAGLRGGNANQLVEPLKQLVEEMGEADVPIWTNLPACQSIGHFCELPPIKGKNLQKLIDAEVKQRIPIDQEDLAIVTWCQPLDKELGMGRPLMMAAATKLVVQRHVDLLGSAGLKVHGLVPEPIALANFAAREFADLISPQASDADDTGDETISQSQPTVALVDVGASKTTLLLVSPVSIWFWTLEYGGEEATTVVAKETKLTKADAETRKRNLESFEQPGVVGLAIAEKQDALRARLVKLREEACKTFAHLDIQQTWCIGRGRLQHGFVRRVLLGD